MDRTRFQHLLDCYGADFRRWPADERGSAAIFASRHAEEASVLLAHAQALDRVLAITGDAEEPTSGLRARILARAPARPVFDRRAVLALAACAVFGVALGYGGGLLAPPPQVGGDFIAAFELPFDEWEDEG